MPEPRAMVHDIANEHIAWAQASGLTQYEVMQSVGEPSTPFVTDWDDARFAVAIAWLGITGRCNGQ